jgi:hypothetical protein
MIVWAGKNRSSRSTLPFPMFVAAGEDVLEFTVTSSQDIKPEVNCVTTAVIYLNPA